MSSAVRSKLGQIADQLSERHSIDPGAAFEIVRRAYDLGRLDPVRPERDKERLALATQLAAATMIEHATSEYYSPVDSDTIARYAWQQLEDLEKEQVLRKHLDSEEDGGQS